jgi:DNA mismatch repair protein MutS2
VPQSEQWAGLEFPRVLEMLGGFASSTLTRELIRNVSVVFHPARIDENLDQTAELLTLRERYPTLDFPRFSAVTDLQPLWESMAAGEVVDAAEARALRQFFELVQAFGGVRAKLTPAEFPRLADLTSSFSNMDELYSLTLRIFSPEGEVRDTASMQLAEIRHKLRRYEAEVTADLSAVMRTVRDTSGEEALLTVRNNRFVVVIPRSMLGSLQGSIVDVSGSGQSVYFEPAAISRTNAERQHLFLAEMQEVRRILLEYGQAVGGQLSLLRANLGILLRFDYVLARARFALELRAKRPRFVHDGGFILNGAVHPLLWKTFVAEDLVFDHEHALIISGVNAGGKTVLLKLLGLYSLLAGLGCYLPGEAQLPYISGVLADIGDEQSTAANLSTFTAHLQCIRQLQDQLAGMSPDDPPLLVLIDEIGTGTEPGEGAAFAYGLVTALLDRPVKLAVTTHYDLLKTLAYERPQVKNVCLQFDQEKLRATYRVLDNQPGQSFALAIAERWGVAPEVLASAHSVLGEEERKMAAIIGALETAKVDAEETRARIAAQAAELERIREDNVKLTAELRESKQKFARQAEELKAQVKQRMDDLLVDTKRRLKEKARQSVRKQDDYVKAASKTAALTRRKQDEAEAALGSMLTEMDIPAPEPVALPVLRVGDKALLRDSRLSGSVESIDEARGTATLLVNGKRLAVKLDQLVAVDPPRPASPTRPRNAVDPVQLRDDRARVEKAGGGKQPSRLERSFNEGLSDSSDMLDLHGMTTEEAGEQLDEFISTCLLIGHPGIRVMHGIGTGRLRNFVQSYLKRHPQVTNVRFAGLGEGGVGVTVADLR